MRKKTIAVFCCVVIVSCSSNDRGPKNAGITPSAPKPETVQLPPVEQTEPKGLQPTLEKRELLDSLSSEELWEKYAENRADADELLQKGEYRQAIASSVMAGECALKLRREDIAAWQFNNAAKHGIDYFRTTTAFDERMQKIGSMHWGDEKRQYIDDTRKLFLEHIAVINDARGFLDRANGLNERNADSVRTAVIESNKSFMLKMKRFVE